MGNIIYPQLDGVKINEDRTLPVSLIQAIRKAYDYIAQGEGTTAKSGGTPSTPTTPTGPDATGPVTGFTLATEVGTRYAGSQDRLVHMTVGVVPIVPVPQSVTILVSQDNGATWTWIGAQRMLTVGQILKVDQLAPGQTGMWMVAAVSGNPGGNPTPFPDSQLNTLYPGAVRSVPFQVLGLATPPASMGITATIGSQYNVISADGLTQYGVIPGLTYTDPVIGTDFFVRITTEGLDASKNTLTPEQPHGGTQITGPGNPHTEANLQIVYIPGLAFIRYRFYTANRNSQGAGDFTDPTTNTLQMVKFNNNPVLANHYDVPITIPPFTPIDPGTAFNVVSVTASEVGPKYQDTNQGLHTTVGIVPVIDHDYSSPRTVTIWLDFGTGQPIWQGWYSLKVAAQVVRIGDSTLGTDGVRKSGDIWVPANTAQGSWIVYCGAGHLDDGIDPHPYASATFTVVPVAACLPNGTTNAQFVQDVASHNQIIYSLWYPGIWYWSYYELSWIPPSINKDPNFWFTLITIQKGATISGTWTPAPDSEGVNENPNLDFLGRVVDQISQLPGLANDQVSTMSKFGSNPANWTIPPMQNDDGTPYLYRDYRFLMYNVSRLGTDTSGSGGAGTYTLQTSCWPGGADHYILTPQIQTGSLDIRAANPATITLPLTGGNGQPLTVEPGTIGSSYLADGSVTDTKMAAGAITVLNDALAAEVVIDPKIKTVGINKVTYGTSVFAGDVVLSRGIGSPIIYLKNTTSGPDPNSNPTGIYLFGQSDASNGTSGLTSKPYIVIKSNAIALFQGGPTTGSVLLDATNNAITIYNVQGDTTHPYFTVNATGLALVNGLNSFGVNSNAMTFIDKGNSNRIDINSAGIAMTNKLNPDGTVSATANQVVILPTGLQFILAGVPQITVNASTGITLSNGGATSVEITSSQVVVTASGVQVNISPNSIQMIQGVNHVTITATGILLTGGGSSQVQITSSSVVITNGSLTSPVINGGSITGTSLSVTASGTVTSITTTSAGVQVQNGSDIGRLLPSSLQVQSGGITSTLSFNVLNIGSGGTPVAALFGGGLRIQSLPSAAPSQGQFWYDPADGNRVKYVP